MLHLHVHGKLQLLHICSTLISFFSTRQKFVRALRPSPGIPPIPCSPFSPFIESYYFGFRDKNASRGSLFGIVDLSLWMAGAIKRATKRSSHHHHSTNESVGKSVSPLWRQEPSWNAHAWCFARWVGPFLRVCGSPNRLPKRV